MPDPTNYRHRSMPPLITKNKQMANGLPARHPLEIGLPKNGLQSNPDLLQQPSEMATGPQPFLGCRWIADGVIPHPLNEHLLLHFRMRAVVTPRVAILLIISKGHRPRAARINCISYHSPIRIWRRAAVLGSCDVQHDLRPQLTFRAHRDIISGRVGPWERIDVRICIGWPVGSRTRPTTLTHSKVYTEFTTPARMAKRERFSARVPARGSGVPVSATVASHPI